MTRLKSSVRRSGGLEVFLRTLDTEGVRQAVNEGARVVRNLARRSIRARDKSGREYTRPRGDQKRQKYRASKAGEAPARYSGHLVDHVRMFPAKKNQKRVVAWVGSASPHAHLLEFGTRNMAARPFMQPAARKAKAQNFTRIKSGAKQDVRRAAAKARAAIGQGRRGS